VKKEIKKLKDKYHYNDLIYGSPDEKTRAKQISSFNNWCSNYTGESLKETGEMSRADIEPGGAEYEWAKMIEDDVKEIAVKSFGKLEFNSMNPFDKYQGPYALVSINGTSDRIWSIAEEGKYLYIERLDIAGEVADLAAAIKGDEDALAMCKRNIKDFRAAIGEVESLQITQRAELGEVKKAKKLRRSTRPLKKHTDVADKFLEVRKAIDDLSQQAAAVGAIIGEKERVAGNLSRELMDYAEEYKDRIIQTKNIFIQLQDIPSHKAKVPAYKKVMDHMLDMLEGVSKDMRKEAEAFIEDAKREVPGETELLYKEIMKEGRTSVMGEGWAAWRRILDVVGGLAAKSRNRLKEIKDDWQEFLGGLETDVWGD